MKQEQITGKTNTTWEQGTKSKHNKNEMEKGTNSEQNKNKLKKVHKSRTKQDMQITNNKYNKNKMKKNK